MFAYLAIVNTLRAVWLERNDRESSVTQIDFLIYAVLVAIAAASFWVGVRLF